MSMDNNVPEIRFEGYSEDWKNTAIRELAFFNPKGELPERFKYVDLGAVKGVSLIAYRNESKESSPSRAQRLAMRGDVFYQTVRPYQKNNYLFDKEDSDYVFSTGYAQLRPYSDGNFLLNIVQRESFVRDVLNNCTGTSYPAINASVLAGLEVSYPTTEKEQTQIGAYFYQLDSIINQHQKKHDKLKNIKRAMLEKMFPKTGETVPEIRFEEGSGDWEEIQLSDEVTFINGRAYCQEELLDKGKYKVLRVGNFYTNSSWYFSDMELGDKYYANYGDLLYTWSASFGPHVWNGDKVIYHYHIWKLELSDNIDKLFLLHLLDYDREKILSGSNGSTMIHITKFAMEAKKVFIPKKDEQAKIGKYFQQLDKLISQHQQQITKLNK
tara:strand:- start:41 stop:1186 length:1146 start_codon:yes stop_codon:yes gene_type:complete